MSRRPAVHPYLALLIGVVFISFSAILVRSSSAPPTVIAAYRLLFAVLLMIPFWLKHHRWELAALTAREWGLALLSGAFLALHFALWFTSLFYTTVASSTVLVTLQPVFAFVGAYLIFRERTRWSALSGDLIAVVGGMVLGWGDLALGGTAWLGDLLALAGAAMVTGYWLTGQHLRQKLSLLTYTGIVYGTAALFLFIASWWMDLPLIDHPPREWLIFLLLAIFPTLLGHSLLNWVIRWVPATTVSVTILGEPVGASLLAYGLFHEQPTLTQWTGGLLILFGVYRFIRNNRKEEVYQQSLNPKRSVE